MCGNYGMGLFFGKDIMLTLWSCILSVYHVNVILCIIKFDMPSTHGVYRGNNCDLWEVHLS